MASNPLIVSFRNVFIALLVIGSLATGCKRLGSESDVDPREQYLGTYSGGAQISTNVGGFEYNPESYSMVVTVTKAANDNEIYLDKNYNNGALTERVTAQLTGTTFKVIDKTRNIIRVNGNTQVEGDYSSQGVLENNTIAMTSVTEARQSGAVVRLVESVNATRK
ncbi:hypothetical protein [Spirosoma sp. KUDC1026]|uniref:hypothetical protein n=1 Tax=Spirosoma sp. KUDC1026 TaxID=2745947 RepID=UPI00159B8FDE|nr:hypothetical protein [Spirosoma sp. KUDC1026]QKZ14997.1 hypothetical protein HU175_21175 [Spirosoma sp. KUDC1026]